MLKKSPSLLIRPKRDPFCAALGALIAHEKQTTTWRELAERTYVSPATFQKYVRGDGRYIRIDTLRGILHALGMGPLELPRK